MSDIFFGKDTVNRVSFLREDGEFVKQIARFPLTSVIFLYEDSPLFDASGSLLKVSLKNLSPLQQYLQLWSDSNEAQDESLRKYPSIVFLGLDDKAQAQDHQVFTYKNKYSGTPYFAIDLTYLEPSGDLVNNTEITPKPVFSWFKEAGIEYTIAKGRFKLMSIANYDASLFSYAKMYVDWLNKQNFCPQCGAKTLKIQAGSKMLCLSPKNQCASKNMSVSNIQFPRTDPVCIVAVVNEQNNKILLANGLRNPDTKFYSCVAGFMEPAENIETCCLREIWEETGVKCNRIQIVLSQPWPYPANLMIGCIGFVDFNGTDEVIDLGNDPELRDAQWFDFEKVRQLVLNNGTAEGARIKIPPKTAIAYSLIDSAINMKYKYRL